MGTGTDRDALAATADASGAARAALVAAARAQRDELLVLASHDLRNAVGIVDSALTMALDAPDMALPMHGMMRRATHRLGILTKAMVDLDLLQRGLMPLSPASRSLEAVVAPVIDAATEVAATKAVTVESKGCRDIDAVVDATVVERIVAALLEHAIGNAPDNSVVDVDACRLSAERVEIRVTHRGRPVNAAVVDGYFTTLPLRFARAAAERHGGGLTVASPVEAGVGVAFVLALAA